MNKETIKPLLIIIGVNFLWGIDFIAITPAGLLITIATAVICIIIGQFGYVYAIGHLSPTVVSAFENVLPVTTVVLSVFIFGKMLTGLQIAGAVLILAAVTVIATKSG